jgi:hypothetical protein
MLTPASGSEVTASETDPDMVCDWAKTLNEQLARRAIAKHIPYKLHNLFMNSTFVLKFKTLQTIHYVLAICYAIISIRLPKAIKFIDV